MNSLDALMTGDMTALAVMGLVMLSIGGVLFALLQPAMSSDKRRNQRISTIKGVDGKTPGLAIRNRDADKRRKSVKDQLDQLEQRTQQKNAMRTKPSLRLRIEQAGLSWDVKRFIQISIVTGVLATIIFYVFSGNVLIALLGGFAGAFGLPRFYINRRRKKRFTAFMEELPNGVDIIVRGVKAGLPLGDCVRVVSTEAKDPVSTEFAKILETQKMGVSLAEAFMKLPERVPLPEANFFAIVVAIQQSSGGGLSEALNNLSRVLRGRKALKRKIVALSSEAKSSAGIIGAMPVLISLALFFIAPDYINILLTTTAGHIVIAGCITWMLIGILVMRQMINFDF